MRGRFLVVLQRAALAIALVSVMAAPAWCQDSGARIPAAHGATLSGAAVALPDALKGTVGVLVLGFSHGSQEQVANWGRLLAAQYGQSPQVRYFEVPMLAGAPKMLRGMIVKSMGKGVPAMQRSHFLPIEDDRPWRSIAHYDKADDAYVLVVEGDGVVRWQTQGDATDATWGNLKQRLDQLLAASNKR